MHATTYALLVHLECDEATVRPGYICLCSENTNKVRLATRESPPPLPYLALACRNPPEPLSRLAAVFLYVVDRPMT
jgi:hypothetical protein